MYSKNIWLEANEEKVNKIMEFNEGYKKYISLGKTERVCVELSVEIAEQHGYKNLKQATSIKPGDKFYLVNLNKNIVLFNVGKRPINEGMRVLGAHIDSPRLDVKQNPLYERRQ